MLQSIGLPISQMAKFPLKKEKVFIWKLTFNFFTNIVEVMINTYSKSL